MVKQERALRTRQAILSAAARIFEERSYQAATISEILADAGVTKGALYFHFPSKESLAQGVLHEQNLKPPAPDHPCKIQQLIDTVVLHAHRLQTDPMVRAGVRLSLDQQAQGLDRSGPFHAWSQLGTHLLQQAKNQGELLPHVTPAETADVLVGAFAGVQAMSQAQTNYQDLPTRVSALLRHILPSITIPTILTTIDLTPTRGATIHNQLHTTT
ncbi:ScbR family autoregulator-binding transcription factor [Streptomyces sp. NPDC054766]|uniref:ScbR family autoregulator-binding transcription factor n=1 Tax=Streptomyces rhizosphaerihabitans TaxID=1266770 RepID=UPI0021BFBA71|nr:ScbR family autoregulator-binding transcription factor [Streptomyces rhizosphaerihabitans]MCT9011814.1 TetR/AcrR family transcriptional regulator [Streptomyces rhizosphaerihabitans]